MSDPHSNRLVILDRDGVINEDSDAYIKSAEEWTPIPGSIEAIARLSKAGFRLAVATNQSGLARGYFDEITLANMHSLMCGLVEEQGGHIEGIFYCPHGPEEGCRCRKPSTGLLEQISDEFDMSVANAWYVGDSAKDLELAIVMHCKPILVRTGKGRMTEAGLSRTLKALIPVVDDLAAAAELILSRSSSSTGNGAGGQHGE